MERLKISNLGPIKSLDIELGDLTFFVGPQASGKSVALQALKLVVDRDSIGRNLNKANYIVQDNPVNLLNTYFGQGLASMWKESTSVSVDGECLQLSNLARRFNKTESSVFYIPAQRVMCMNDGFPRAMSDYTTTMPYVVREFSETIRNFLLQGLGNNKIIFPIDTRLKLKQRSSFDSSIFHGGKVVIDESTGQRRLILDIDSTQVPFMAWSAGQKEFMPLLIGVYCLTGPPQNVVRREKFKTVIIEEPEMGLHPRAILSVLLQMCEFLQSGYRVVVSTHSSLMLEFAWAFNLLKDSANFESAMTELFGINPESKAIRMITGLNRFSAKTYYFSRSNGKGKVATFDISHLDIYAEREFEADWGGLSEFSTRVNDVVAKYIE